MQSSIRESLRDMHGIPVNVFFDEPDNLERDRRTLEFLNDCWSAGCEAVVATVIDSQSDQIAVGDRLFVTSAGAVGSLLATPIERELLRHARACLCESRSRGVSLGACEVWFEWAAAPLPVVVVEDAPEPVEVPRAFPEAVVANVFGAEPEPKQTGFAAVLNRNIAKRAPEDAIHIVRPASAFDAAVADIRSKLRVASRSLHEPPELPAAADPPRASPPDRFPLFRTA